jgi:hypothetical protein
VNGTRERPSEARLLGDVSFVKRTFEGRFVDAPFVLDMDANLYIGPADQYSRDLHSSVEVVLRYLRQTGRIEGSMRQILCNRAQLLRAFVVFDAARGEGQVDEDGVPEFRVVVHGSYDGEPLEALRDDDLPAGPCGASVNEVKLHFYRRCMRLDSEFHACTLEPELLEQDDRLRASVHWVDRRQE